MPNQLNEIQDKAIHFYTGPMQLLAGPGSGKTFVLTHRIQNLIEYYHIYPSKILVITFTKAAALEMENRFLKLMAPQKPKVHFGTFHSIFFQIIKNTNEYRNATLITEKEKTQLLEEILLQLNLNDYTDFDTVRQILDAISCIKNQYTEEPDFQNPILAYDELKTIYEEYTNHLKDMKKIDYDDMILLCLHRLKQDKNLLANVQMLYEFVLIDEFQDINTLQYEVIKMLTKEHQNIFIVGDDDQSIYGFRGAKPDIMKQFMMDFHNATQLIMNMNYRSCQEIVEFSGNIIIENINRYSKIIKASKTEPGLVDIAVSKSYEDQFAGMISYIDQCNLQQISFDDIAILVRTNKELDEISLLLKAKGIPYKRKEKEHSPLEKSYFQDLLAYLEFANGNYDRTVFFRFMNKPLRYIKRDACKEDYISERGLLKYYNGNLRMQQKIQNLFQELNYIKQIKPLLAINYIRKIIGYDIYMQEQLNPKQWSEYLEHMKWFTDSIRTFRSYEDLVRFCHTFEVKTQDNTMQKRGVSLMTYHGSKGLEFPVVMLPNLVEGKVPYRQSRQREEIEEERRMFYVALTRAEKQLILFTVANEKEMPSRFIKKQIASLDIT